ncbi:hypothetical protein CC86DRAFT_162102 [Ophiobolus disseminans]|uniref:C2H2-type domain-containing protein n=1 Tax=Ophiobolus disseminans TaxID=1469910 RepID=A0A6A7AD18_9PLEO|nr:hypothetical protein CC86DRAFT_162102 [Ophiobolus disseminans]
MAIAHRPNAVAAIGIVTASLCLFAIALAIAYRQRQCSRKNRQQSSLPSEEANIQLTTPHVAVRQQRRNLSLLSENIQFVCSHGVHSRILEDKMKDECVIIQIGKKQSAGDLRSLLRLDGASFLRDLPSTGGQSIPLIVAPAMYAAPHQLAVDAGAHSKGDGTGTERCRHSPLNNVSSNTRACVIATVPPSDSGVNPWDLEMQPNPVMFPHLATPGSLQIPEPFFRSHFDDEEYIIPARLEKAREVRMVGPDFTPSPYSYVVGEFHMTTELIDSTVNFETMESWSSEDTACSWASTAITAVDDDWMTVAPAPTETLSELDKCKHWFNDPADAAPIVRFDAATSAPTHWDITDTSTYRLGEEGDQIQGFRTQMNDDSEIPKATSTEIPMYFQAIGEPELRGPLYACFKCGLNFRTPGLRRNHENRKHNPRYICPLCNAAFGLRADLERHRTTKHAKELNQKPKRVYLCPHSSCVTRGKEYYRNDNFKRHVKRCEKTIAKSKGKDGPAGGRSSTYE